MIRLHDTKAREKRDFEPADPDRVTLYVCGPTVYNRAHIGNARPAVVFDVLAGLLRHTYGADKVVYARNVTDVDDKIIDAARAEGVDPAVVTRRYEDFYLADMGALGVRPPDLAPKATETVAGMVAMIARLIETGNAYEADGHVLFHVPSDPGYGTLGRRDREAMIAGARVEIASYKKDPADFVLWKPSDAAVIGWDSPWGRGRPGWHIECSAMIERHLGTTIDIHGGGLDLIFPHHENELAQSRCAHGGAPLARYWVHNGFLSMADGEKMSKSLGNVVTVGELLDQGHKGETLRLALLSAHYRQPLEWSPQLVAQSKATLDRLYRSLLPPVTKRGEGDIADVEAALRDDLNTPLALARLGELARLGDAEATKRAGALLGLLQQDPVEWFQGAAEPESDRLDPRVREDASGFGLGAADIQLLIDRRAQAKKARDFGEADRVRAELAAQGILLEDGPQGTTWRRA
ncbi:MAG TPA: cysteine--tRNA ligase [Allosphingosinicella sp.]|jgi:cysteinyl-tRNA synthetase|nr:cysteine--tRNA ligase [Allosphingosinicella sp.]